jgi:hypothetical protein
MLAPLTEVFRRTANTDTANPVTPLLFSLAGGRADTPVCIPRPAPNRWHAQRVEYGDELYAERLRRKAQAEALATEAAQWTDELEGVARLKLKLAWTDAVSVIGPDDRAHLVSAIKRRTLRSLGRALEPDNMEAVVVNGGGYRNSSEDLLSLIEAEHEALKQFADSRTDPWGGPTLRSGASGFGFGGPPVDADAFRADVNRILGAHLVAFHLHDNGRLVPVASHEMHDAVVAPTLYLLHSEPKFAGAETAYQNALKELRNHDAGDAITDAATALQEVLTALGCAGGALGDLLSSAKKTGLLTGADTHLTESIVKTVNWVAAKRNQGEAHRGDPDMNMSDAWMMVHVVGALAIRLSEADKHAQT